MKKNLLNQTLLFYVEFFQVTKGAGLMKYNFELSMFKSGVNFISLSKSEIVFVIPINKLHTKMEQLET